MLKVIADKYFYKWIYQQYKNPESNYKTLINAMLFWFIYMMALMAVFYTKDMLVNAIILGFFYIFTSVIVIFNLQIAYENDKKRMWRSLK